MNVLEMHKMFRELTQQMGMQTIRAVLEEDIDTCLNIAINDTIKKVITENVAIAGNDKVLRDNAKIGQINALRTLYKKVYIDAINVSEQHNCYSCQLDTNDILLITSFSVSYENKNYFDARITDIEYLNRTLQDFCNRASYDSPVITTTSENDKLNVDIYNDYNKVGDNIIKVCATVITKPAVVKYSETVPVNCDLPDYMHIDIVKYASEVWLKSVGATSN